MARHSSPLFSVAHRLPGRVRCYSPLVKTGGSAISRIIEAVQSELIDTPAITDVTIDRRTGSILITYNHSSIDEAELIEIIRAVAMRHIETLNQLNGASGARAVIPWLSAMHAREKR